MEIDSEDDVDVEVEEKKDNVGDWDEEIIIDSVVCSSNSDGYSSSQEEAYVKIVKIRSGPKNLYENKVYIDGTPKSKKL